MLNTLLKSLFFDETLYGYAEIDEELKELLDDPTKVKLWN